MADFTVSLLLLAGIVLVSEAGRRSLRGRIPAPFTGLAVYASELVSTFQLCACTHELKLLGEVGGGLEPRWFALALTYLASVVHALTFRGAATGNPCATLERAYRRSVAARCAFMRMACQFAAAVLARSAVRLVWTLGLSDLHLRHTMRDFRCVNSPIRASLAGAAAVEMAGAFAVQTAVTHTQAVEERYRVHAVATVVTSLVYAGGSVTGAVFNPALAFSTQFPCGGHTFLEYCLVYWLAPVLGMMSSVLLSDRILPLLSAQSGTDAAYRPLEAKKRQ